MKTVNRKPFYWLVMSVLIQLNNDPIVAFATQSNDPPSPYMVTQEINDELISREDCISILQNMSLAQGDEVSTTQQLVTLEQEMQSIQAEFDQLNRTISELESGPEESLLWANGELESAIELVFNELMIEDPDFAQLSQDDQLAKIETNEVIIGWQNYIQGIQALINENIAQRDNLEQTYLNLSDRYEGLLDQASQAEDLRNLYNQAQLYSYASPYLAADQILINHQLTLTDFLLQVKGYLKKVVAKPYYMVKYEDIYQAFANQLIRIEEEPLATKIPMILDSLAYDKYSYAKELTLADIDLLAYNANIDRSKTQDETGYQAAYQAVINLKESQWGFIYQINTPAIQRIQEELASFLNQQNLTDDDVIRQVKDLQDSFQVKLVLFDENQAVWLVNDITQSGFYETYSTRSLRDLPNEPADEIELGELTPLEEVEISQEEQESKSDLSGLKDKLTAKKKQSSVKDLKKPNKSKQAKGSSDTSKKKSGNIELPSTGEKRPLTYLAITLLIIGLVITGGNLRRKKAKRRQLKEIHLD